MSELARIAAESVPECKALRLSGGPDGVCLVRLGERYFAVADRCSHADVRLSEGEVDDLECSIECWKHGSTFSLVDGHPQSLPATVAVAVYSVRVEGSDVVVTDE